MSTTIRDTAIFLGFFVVTSFFTEGDNRVFVFAVCMGAGVFASVIQAVLGKKTGPFYLPMAWASIFAVLFDLATKDLAL